MGDRNITVTLKAGESFKDPWVVIGGDTLEEINHQLDTILQAGTLQKASQVAIAFHNGFRAIRHGGSSPEQQGPPPETYSQPPVGSQQAPPATQAAPQGSAQAPPWDNWSSAPQQAVQQPPVQPQDPWAGAPNWATGQPGGQQPQQQAPAPQQGGAPVCQCRKVMEHKVTGGGKPVWRCPDWRWNNGTPTPNHDQIWVEGN